MARYRRSPRLPDLVENGRRYVQTAWPQAQSRDGRSRCAGFLMPAVDTQAAGAMAIADFLSNGPADAQRMHDGFPIQLLRRNGVRAERFALLQARADQILKEAGSHD